MRILERHERGAVHTAAELRAARLPDGWAHLSRDYRFSMDELVTNDEDWFIDELDHCLLGGASDALVDSMGATFDVAGIAYDEAQGETFLLVRAAVDLPPADYDDVLSILEQDATKGADA